MATSATLTPATHEWTVAPCNADAAAPTMTCVSEVIYACALDLVVDPTTFGPAVDDTCGVTTTYESPESWALGSNEVTFTAEDAAGNRATCVTTVVIADTIAPALACADATLSTPAGRAVSPTFAATDACGAVDVTGDAGPGGRRLDHRVRRGDGRRGQRRDLHQRRHRRRRHGACRVMPAASKATCRARSAIAPPTPARSTWPSTT